MASLYLLEGNFNENGLCQPLILTMLSQRENQTNRYHYQQFFITCCLKKAAFDSERQEEQTHTSHDGSANGSGGSAQWTECLTKKPAAMLMWVQFPRVTKNLSPSVDSLQTLLHCLCSTHVQLHTPTLVCTLKIPNTGSLTIVWTPDNTAHIGGNG